VEPAFQLGLQCPAPARCDGGALPAPAVEAYTAVDANWSWKVTPTFTASLLAQNLFDRRHVEFNAVGVASQIERRAFVRLAWQL
jgi:iron complex outermembrane receptor protein